MDELIEEYTKKSGKDIVLFHTILKNLLEVDDLDTLLEYLKKLEIEFTVDYSGNSFHITSGDIYGENEDFFFALHGCVEGLCGLIT